MKTYLPRGWTLTDNRYLQQVSLFFLIILILHREPDSTVGREPAQTERGNRLRAHLRFTFPLFSQLPQQPPGHPGRAAGPWKVSVFKFGFNFTVELCHFLCHCHTCTTKLQETVNRTYFQPFPSDTDVVRRLGELIDFWVNLYSTKNTF